MLKPTDDLAVTRNDQRLTLTVDEAAKALGIATKTAYLYMKAGTIPSITIGRRRVVPVDALRAYIASRASAEAQS